MLYQSTGILRYSYGNSGYKLIVEVDQEISDFYRSLIPKWIQTNRQMYPAHITVVRKETPLISYWGKYEGQEVEFYYSNEIFNGEVYYWLNAFSKRLEEIRIELGLPISSKYTRPPNGFEKCFHITIGNLKNDK